LKPNTLPFPRSDSTGSPQFGVPCRSSDHQRGRRVIGNDRALACFPWNRKREGSEEFRFLSFLACLLARERPRIFEHCQFKSPFEVREDHFELPYQTQGTHHRLLTEPGGYPPGRNKHRSKPGAFSKFTGSRPTREGKHPAKPKIYLE